MASYGYRSGQGSGAGDGPPEWDNPQESNQDFVYDELQDIAQDMRNLGMTEEDSAPTDPASFDYTLSNSLPPDNVQDPAPSYLWKGKGRATGDSTPRQVNFGSPLQSSTSVILDAPQENLVSDSYTNQPPTVDPAQYDQADIDSGEYNPENTDLGIVDDDDEDGSSWGRSSPEQAHQTPFLNPNHGPFSPPPQQSDPYTMPGPARYIIRDYIPYSPGIPSPPTPQWYSYNPSPGFPMSSTPSFPPYAGSGSLYSSWPQTQPAQTFDVDISFRINSKRERWEEATAMIDTGNKAGPLISISKVLDLGYDHSSREISFNSCKEIQTGGGSLTTLGTINLCYRHRNPKGRPQNLTFHIWEPQMESNYDVLFPSTFAGDRVTSNSTVSAVNSLVLSKKKLTREEKLAQRDRFIEQEEEAERARKEREAKKKKGKDAGSSSSSSSKRHDSSSSSSHKKR